MTSSFFFRKNEEKMKYNGALPTYYKPYNIWTLCQVLFLEKIKNNIISLLIYELYAKFEKMKYNG